MSKLLHSFINGGTKVDLYSNGTKVRTYFNGEPPVHPETIDVKITGWCNNTCSYCHENSTPRGKHGDLTPTINLLKQLQPGSEIAIGGGHAMAHPQFDEFVTELSNHGIICNVTINEYHFEQELPRIERLVADNKLYGIGYSYSTKPCTWKYDNLVTHLITGVTHFDQLQDVVKYNNKVLLLGYKKSTGRGDPFYKRNMALVDSKIKSWYVGLFRATDIAELSFDNLAIGQLNPRRLFANKEQYDGFFMGRDGHYSMYMDAVKQQYAVSSTADVRFEYGSNMAEMFSHVRKLTK